MKDLYQYELDKLERENEGTHEQMLCDRCKREFRATVETGFVMPKEWICPICEEDAEL